MLKTSKLILRRTAGVLLVGLGILIGPLPGPLGIPLILLGLELLGQGPQSRAWLRRKWAAIRAYRRG